MEKVRREELKKENIIKDLVKYEKEMRLSQYEWRSVFILPIISIGVVLGFLTHRFWVGLIVALPAVYHLAMLIIFLVGSNKRLAAMKRGEFAVTLDKLTNISHETNYGPHVKHSVIVRFRTKLTREVDYLWFDGWKWRPCQRKLYTWSENYPLTHDGILNTSVIGNEFYVVHFGKEQEIYCVYNTKFFVWNK